MNSAQYHEATVLKAYVIQWYEDLMTKLEKDVVRACMLEQKAFTDPSPIVRRKIAEMHLDEGVHEILKLGVDGARQWVVDQVLSRSRAKIDLNRCPACKRIVR